MPNLSISVSDNLYAEISRRIMQGGKRSGIIEGLIWKGIHAQQEVADLKETIIKKEAQYQAMKAELMNLAKVV